MTRPWRMILTTFFASVGKSTNSNESLAEEHNFLLHENAFTPKSFRTSEQFTLNYVDCKQVADVINAMPSNRAPGIDKVLTRVIKDSLLIILHVNHQCFYFSFNQEGGAGGEGAGPRNDVVTTCKAVTRRGGQRIIAVFFPQ